MTRIAFHFGAEDKWRYASRLLRKAVARGSQVVVVVDPQDLQQMDSALWSISPAEFIPHCQLDALDSVRRRSRIVMVDSQVESTHVGDVMVNLGTQLPYGLDQFERVIEVVSTDETERNQARQRWKQYAESGFPIDKHDIQAQEGR